MFRAPRTIALLAPVLVTAVSCATAAPAAARRLAESPEAPAPESTKARHGSGRCTLSLQAAPATPAASGEPVTLAGRMSCPEPADAEGRPVSILARRRGGALEEVATVTTGVEGAFEVSEPVTANTVFLARAYRARRARAVVEVGATITLAGPSGAAAALSTRGRYRRAARAARVTFTGTVVPATDGLRVALQRRWLATGEPWHTVARTRTGEGGTFSFAHGFRSAGQVSVRTVAHMRGGAASYSNELTYTIAQAQNSALTIAAAADPLPAGQSTTVSGVLASGAGHAVLLLARTAGQPYQAVGSVETGEGGAYSFTFAPAVNTTFRVRAGRVESTQLFLGVLPKLSLTSVPAGAALGSSVSFEGTIAGAPAGAPVRLETERGGGRFTTVTSGVLQADGSFALSYAFPRAGTYTLLIRTPAGRTTVGASSEPFTVAVTAPDAEP